jgi:LysR family transcriptional regulator, low CO2-responsive transcriptional regulator
VQGFPAMLNWYLVHNRTKRLPPVAAAFKEFLLRDGATLIERLTSVGHAATSGPRPGRPRSRARRLR